MTQKFDPKLKYDFPFFDQKGTWGAGGDFEAECTIEAFEFPSMTGPNYDIDRENGPYALFSLLCVREGERNIRENWFVKTGQAWGLLPKLGVEIDAEGYYEEGPLEGMSVQVVTGDPGLDKDTGAPRFSKVKTLIGIR